MRRGVGVGGGGGGADANTTKEPAFQCRWELTQETDRVIAGHVFHNHLITRHIRHALQQQVSN